MTETKEDFKISAFPLLNLYIRFLKDIQGKKIFAFENLSTPGSISGVFWYIYAYLNVND